MASKSQYGRVRSSSWKSTNSPGLFENTAQIRWFFIAFPMKWALKVGDLSRLSKIIQDIADVQTQAVNIGQTRPPVGCLGRLGDPRCCSPGHRPPGTGSQRRGRRTSPAK